MDHNSKRRKYDDNLDDGYSSLASYGRGRERNFSRSDRGGRSDYRNDSRDGYRNDLRDDYRNDRRDDYRNDHRDDYRNDRRDDYRSGSSGHRDQRDGDRGDSFGSRGRGGGGFRGGRGGGRGGGGDREGFRKPAGGDSQRMPESIEHIPLVQQKLSVGTEGKPIELVGNFYRLIHSNTSVFHYDIEIVKLRQARSTSAESKPASSPPNPSSLPTTSPDVNSSIKIAEESKSNWEVESLSEERKTAQERFIKRFSGQIVKEFISGHEDIFHNVAYVFDGVKNIYTTKCLQLGSDSNEIVNELLKVDIEGRPAFFRVTFKLVASVSLGDALDYYNNNSTEPVSERTISILDIVLRFIIGKTYQPYQRKFFDIQQVEHSPKVKMCDFVQGFINSVRMTEFGLALNVHLKTSCIISKSYVKLDHLVADILNLSGQNIGRLNSRQFFEVNKIIRHLKIATQHSKRSVTYTVDSLLNKHPKEEIFQRKGKNISIEDYFLSEYDIRLKDLPMVKCSGKGNIHVPLELCYLQEAQFLDKSKIDLNVQRELLFKSTHSPNAYFNKEASILKRIKEADSDGLLKKFGMELGLKPVRFSGRVLPAPRTVASNRNDQFYHATSKPPEWQIIVLDDQQYNLRDLQKFTGMLKSKSNQFGLRLRDPVSTTCVRIGKMTDIRDIFEKIHKNNICKLVFIGIPPKHHIFASSDLYNTVKHNCDQLFGLICQCFNADKIKFTPNGYFDNLLLKVNGKIGGQNCVIEPDTLKSLPFELKRTMLVGIDVNHPGERDRVVSSIAVAVGSYDSMFTKFHASIRVQQKQRDEMIKQIDSMIGELLEQFAHKNNGSYPKNMVVFRDGVSEGQFDKLMELEIPLIQRAIKDLGKKIKLTLIVVQKRHHTRFALYQQDTSGRKPTFNVPSGTVVDKVIVDPNLKVFYLNSHNSPLGTSKPTKYIVLHEEMNMSPDELQKLCFYSCFSCARTRTVIAIPTAVRYADLCAYRSKAHIEAQRVSRNDDTGSMHSNRSGGSLAGKDKTEQEAEEAATIAQLNHQARLHPHVRDRLFYC